MVDTFEEYGKVESVKQSQKPNEGDQVHIKGKVNGQYNNVDKVGYEVMKKSDQPVEPRQSSSTNSAKNFVDRDTLILKQVAFKGAIEIENGKGHTQTADETRDNNESVLRVLVNSETFDDWLNGKITAEQFKEKISPKKE